MKNIHKTIDPTIPFFNWKRTLLTLACTLTFLYSTAQTTITSTATGGPWNAGSTWVGGVVPSQGSNNNVVVASGATVTVTAAASAVNLTNNGNLTMSNTGIKLSIGNPGSGTGTLTLGSGSNFFIGSANTVEFVATQTGAGITNNGGTIASSGINGADGGTILLDANSGGGFFVGGSAVTVVNNFKFIQNASFNINGPGIRINGTFTIPNNNWNWAGGSKSPIYGPGSTLYIDRGNQSYNQGIEWSANSGTIGTTPGYPNNVVLVNMGSSVFNGTGWHPTGAVGLNGALHIGDGTVVGRVTLEDVTSFNSGGVIADNNSLIIGPKTGIPFNNSGNFTLTGATTGVFQSSGATINFTGSGTSAAPQTISTTGTTVQFTNMTVSNGTYVQLQSPASISGMLNLNSGYIGTTSSNVLTINNTATTAITGGSATSFIDGPLAWSVGATTTGNYTFPIGNAGTYLPLTLSPNSTSGTIATATAFNQNSGGSPDATVTSLSTTEYWSVTTSSPFSSGPLVSVTRTTGVAPNNALAVSTSANGVYTAIGGTASGNTISGGGIGTNSPAFISMSLAPLSVVKLSGTNITCNGTTGSLTVGGSGGTPPYQYSTDGGVTFQASGTFSPLSPGDHVITVKDGTGTTATATLKVLGSIIINGNDKDVSICSGASTTLVANNLINSTPTYSWSTSAGGAPVIGTSASLTVSPTATTSYYVTSTLYNNNLLTNGSFEAGNSGFTSSYAFYSGAAYATSPTNNGIYSVQSASNNQCIYFTTTNNPGGPTLAAQDGASYFVGDGSVASSVAWSETVSGLTAGNVYKFNFYYAAANPNASRAVLHPTINGAAITGADVTTTNSNGWTQATYTWTATSTSALINLTNLTATGNTNGNDFLLDNMEFLAPCIVTDNIKVIVSTATPGTLSAAQTVCAGATPATLTLSGNTSTTITRWERATNAGFTTGLTALAFTTATLSGANTGISTLPAGVYYFRVVEAGCGTTIYSTSTTITVTNPVTPTFTTPAPFCSGTTAPTLPTSSSDSPAITGTWSPTPVSNTASGTYTFTPSAGQCANTTPLNIVVNNNLAPTITCGTPTTSTVPFSWAAVTGASGYSISTKTGANPAVVQPSQAGTTYTESNLSPGASVQITVTPTGAAPGCFSPANQTCAAVSCPPSTVVVPPASTICKGATVAATNFVSTPAGATFAWTNNTAAIGLAASGTGNVPSFVSANPGATALIATITVTPSVGSCPGTPSTYTITVNPAATNVLSSAAGTNAQTVCINNPLTNITYAIGGSATGATLTGALPAGLSGSYNAGVFTISGTPAVSSATAFNYTISTTGPCAVVTSTGTITVNPVLVPTLSCGTSTTTFTQFTWAAVAGATGYNITSKVGPNPAVNQASQTATTYTQSGLNAGDQVTLTVTPTGPGCFAAGSQTCTAIACTPSTVAVPANNSYCNGDNVPGTSFTSTPAGATYVWTNNNTAIGLAASGTGDIAAFSASNSGTIPITATITVTPKVGPCSGTSNTYTITVNPPATNTLSSAAGTDAQTVCINAPITPIAYAIGGSATGATLTGTLPTGVTGIYDAVTKIFTISGTPSTVVGSPFPYTVSTTGPCPVVKGTGTITVNPIVQPTVSCGAATLTSVQFTWPAVTGATGYAITTKTGTNPPVAQAAQAGTSYTASGLSSGDQVLITVNPTGTGCFSAGTQTCTAVSCTSSVVNVPPASTVCVGDNVPASSFTSTPAGATYTWSNNNTAIGLAASGIGNVPAFTATNSGMTLLTATITVIPTVGPCPGTPNTYMINVNPAPTNVLSSANNSDNQTVCINTPITSITYAVGGSSTGASLTGTLPTGVTGNYDAINKIFTISGTPSTGTGSPFTYSVTTTGPCTPAAIKTGTITVNPVVQPVLSCGTSTISTVQFTWLALTGATSYNITSQVGSNPPVTQAAQPGTSYTATGLSPGDAVLLSVTPTGSGCYAPGSKTCTAVPCTSSVVVVPANAKICHGDQVPATNFSSTPAGASYTWTNSNPSIGLAASGTGNLPAFIANNVGNTTIVATIKVIPAIGPCPGTPSNYTLTVNPKAGNVLSSAMGTDSQSVCLNTPITDIVYAIAGSATGPVLTGKLPEGITGTYDPVKQSFTISGTPSAISPIPFNYTVTTGQCPVLSKKGTIIINPLNVPTLFIPNSFTPNGDNINDSFQAFGEGIIEFDGNIFNRWGELLYHWDTVKGGWNGKIGTTDNIYVHDVYVYTIRVKNECQKKFEPTRQGTVTLVK